MCMCGHLDRPSLGITFCAVVLAGWGLAVRTSLPYRIAAAVIFAFALMLLAKNVLDVGWMGHEPLFR